MVGFFEGCESNVQFWQAVHDLRRLKAHGADTQEELLRVFGVANGFAGQRLALLKMPVTGSALTDGKAICQASFLHF